MHFLKFTNTLPHLLLSIVHSSSFCQITLAPFEIGKNVVSGANTDIYCLSFALLCDCNVMCDLKVHHKYNF